MTLDSRRLAFLLQTKTQKEVSQLTGIPRSTISFVSRGIRKLPEQYRPELRNMYQRTAYHTMKDVGMPASQANRLKWYTPENVGAIITEFSSMVNYLTEGMIASILESQGIFATPESVLDLWDETREKMILALQHSKKPVETMLDY